MDADARKAVTWFHAATEHDYDRAQYQLGKHYAEGLGVDQDFSIASARYLKAAMQGHQPAQYHLGILYGQENGVEKDYIKSYAWMYVASRENEKRALKGLHKVTEKLDHIQLIEAEGLDRSFASKYKSG